MAGVIVPFQTKPTVCTHNNDRKCAKIYILNSQNIRLMISRVEMLLKQTFTAQFYCII